MFAQKRRHQRLITITIYFCLATKILSKGRISCRIKVTTVCLQDLRKFKTKGTTCAFLLQKGSFKMNLIFDFLIGRPQPNNLFWMFSTICTTSCEFGKSGIDLFAIDVLLVVVAELGACNWLSACYKPVSFHLRKNRTTKSKKKSSTFFLSEW